MNYLNKEEFNRYFELLNTLCGDYSRWMDREAQQAHKCEFGCTIPKNKRYFRKEYGLGTAKLCENCMEKILFIIFATDPGTTKIASWVYDKRFERAKKAIKKLR